MENVRAKRNRTIELDPAEKDTLRAGVASPADLSRGARDLIVCCDCHHGIDAIPAQSIDLVVADPPYNLRRTFGTRTFVEQDEAQYANWLDGWISKLPRVMSAQASIYVCCDWRCSSAVERVLSRYFIIQNRITWEREKGRAALRNWKSASEDIWFASLGTQYVYNADAVKLMRRVIAPYTDKGGQAKDWEQNEFGRFRATAASNLWTDLTVPFWSMPENTPHPTQKPEKLLAKIVLASSNPGQLVLDPFVGSGTSAVVAKKLGRHFIGIELEEEYCLLAQKRVQNASPGQPIQGLHAGTFWERNSAPPKLQNM
ncbi:MAG: site-specific DNA-methyltransferase [Oligoflexia bacterium]|nr:site-specific DNA-methyltransferase [Oligoflexia bacterium]